MDCYVTILKNVSKRLFTQIRPIRLSLPLTVCLRQVIKAASETETEDGAQSVVSVPVASEFSVFCNASNQFGADMATFNIKISEFLSAGSCLQTNPDLTNLPPTPQLVCVVCLFSTRSEVQ